MLTIPDCLIHDVALTSNNKVFKDEFDTLLFNICKILEVNKNKDNICIYKNMLNLYNNEFPSIYLRRHDIIGCIFYNLITKKLICKYIDNMYYSLYAYYNRIVTFYNSLNKIDLLKERLIQVSVDIL